MLAIPKSGLGPEEGHTASSPASIVSSLQRTAHYDFSGVEIIPLVILYVQEQIQTILSSLFNQIISPKYLPGRKQKTITGMCFSTSRTALRLPPSVCALPALLSQVEFSGNAMVEF